MANFMHRYHALCHWLQRDFASLVLLLCRIWAGWVFWQSGLSKIANWDSTLYLFAVNAMAVVSYPLLWQQGFTDHQLWGLMLLIVFVWGPGHLSLDNWLSRKWQRVILQN